MMFIWKVAAEDEAIPIILQAEKIPKSFPCEEYVIKAQVLAGGRGKGCCDGVVVNCQRNWVALMNWVHSYQVSLFTEKISLLKKCIQPSAWRRASWSGKVQQGRQRYRRPPGFPHGRSHAGPAELSTPCITSSKSEPFRFNFSKPFPQRWCKDFPGRGTDSLSNTVQVFCKQVNINCPNAIFQIFWQN